VQLSTGDYTYPASVQKIPIDLSTLRTARRRRSRASRLGYEFAEIKRENYSDDIYEINTSTPERQGRPMAAAYQVRSNYGPLPEYKCPRHAVYTYGILKGKLYAYLWLYQVGDLVMISSILGHADYQNDDIMYLLVTEALARHEGIGFYNRHDGGTEGLRYFKEKLGFKPERIAWKLL
jgi:hypothetical protein